MLDSRMGRSSSSSTYNDKKSRRSRSEDYRRNSRTRSVEYMDKRRQAWLIQQEREREHERLKQKMILEYELKREALLRSKDHSGRSSRRSRSKSRSRSRGRRSKDYSRHSPKPTVMSLKLESSGGSIPLFRGPSESKDNTSVRRNITVGIRRHFPETTLQNSDLQRNIDKPEEVIVKRREDEGKKPIFDREELNLNESPKMFKEVEEIRFIECLEIEEPGEGIKPIFDRAELRLPGCSKTSEEVKEHRIVKSINNERPENKIHSSRRRSKSLSPLEKRDESPQETRFIRFGRTIRYTDEENHRKSNSNYRDKNNYKSPNRQNERNDRSGHSSTHHIDRRDYSGKRRSSRERSYSEDRKRRNLEHDRHYDKGGQSYREYRGRSRERRGRERSIEKRSERSRERRIPTFPHYIEPVPVPVYYGNFPRPVMMGPMMPIRGPMMGHRHPAGPRIPFPPRFMHPEMYRSALPRNPRFDRMF